MKNLLLLQIGINHYHPDSGVTTLQGCENDLSAMWAFLQKQYADWTIKPVTLVNEAATYANIIHHFGAAHLLQAKEGDTVLIQYSGHGAREGADPAFARNYPEGKQETWVCYDSRLPGHYDLADKELAVLIQRIADTGAEVVVILDCCHSGSGTRKLADMQLGAARQWDDRPEIRSLETYLDGHFVDNVYNPISRHILLAACDKREKAYELASHRGSFTSHLLSVLEDSEGQLSYAELFARTHILMRRFSDNQTPQFETYGFFNAYAPFLGSGTVEGARHFQVSFDKKEGVWKLDAGALQGMSTAPNQATTFDIYQQKTVVGRASSTFVGLNECELALEADLDTEQIYQARMTSIPERGIAVDLQADKAGMERLRAVLHPNFIEGGNPENGYYPLHFELLENVPAAPFQWSIQNDAIKVIRQEDKTIIAQAYDTTAASFEFLFKQLEHICRWEKTLALDNAHSQNREAVELFLVILDEQGKTIWETKEPETIIDILVENRQERKVPFRLEARNHSGEAWYGALFYLTENYGIYDIYNEEIVAHSTASLMEFNDKNKRYAFELNGKNEATDIFKLIVSKQKIKQEQLTQKVIKLGDSPKRGQSKGIGFGEADVYEQSVLNDWFTHAIKCKAVARKARIGTKDIDLNMEGIKIRGNAAGFQADISLESNHTGSRSMSRLAIFSKMVEGTNASFLPFGNTRSGLAAPNTLVLQNIEHEEKLATEPLIIELNAHLKEEETLMSLTFDGEHILPVGIVEKTENGKATVTITALPEVQPDGTRSLTKALSLCFMKLVLGAEDAQYLRWVAYGLTIERYEEGVREMVLGDTDPETGAVKIEEANNILLLIHGIIGDTAGMAEFARTAYEKGTFDLVLTFDYENLNTSIERTAGALRTKLRAAGITAENNKKITILSHSMGGLVARHFIENMGGKAVVKHLIMAGTPNAGSAVAKAVQYRNYAIPLLALAINTPFSIPAAASILSVLRFSETLTITLAQMDMENDPDKFLVHLNEVGNDPAVPYSIVAGNIQDYYEMGGKFARLMDKVYRLGGQLLYKNAPNDIAVSVESIKTIPTDRQFAPVKIDAACHHLNYFEDAETVRLIDGLMESPTC